LEQRLLETEIALFETLSFVNGSFRSGDNPRSESFYQECFTEDNTTQSRDAKIEEWKRLPLVSAAQRQAWLQEKAYVIEKRSGPANPVIEAVTSQETNQQWTGVPILQLVGRGAAPQSLNHPISNLEVAHDTEEINRNEDREMINAEGSQQSDHLSHKQIEPSGRPLSKETWWNHPEPRQMSTGSNVVAEKAYRMDNLENTSYLLPGQHSPVVRAENEQGGRSAGGEDAPSNAKNRFNSITGNVIENSRKVVGGRFSSKEWQKYF
jgi:hypothetical protein